MHNAKLTRAVKLALLGAGAVGAAAPAVAQDNQGQELEEITVTGTRILRQDYMSASPISTVDAELFQQTGAPTIEKVLNTLPQFVPSITSTSNNPSNGGQANVALRGLGEERTLVLLDGKRIVPSNATGVVDLNLLPASIIESVEIITGGASATYGSDAIAGVVNIKTRDFTGLELTSNYGITSEDDGQTLSFGVTGGIESDDGRAYAFGSLNRADRESIDAGARDFSSVALAWDGDSFEPVGSSTIPQGRIDAVPSNLMDQAALDAYFLAHDPTYDPDNADLDAEAGHNFGFNPDGSLFDTAPTINFTGDTTDPLQPVNPEQYSYNFSPINYLQLPLERTSFFGRAGFQLTENTELYTQLLLADYDAGTALASTPATGLFIRPDNPNLPADVAALLASRSDPDQPFSFGKRMLESGPRTADVSYKVSQFLVGATGSLPFSDEWNWNAYGSLGNVDQQTVQQGNVSRSLFEQLTLGPNFDPDEPLDPDFDHGAAACGSAINPFGINSISPECAALFTLGAINDTTIRQEVGEAFVTGPLFEMPAGSVESAVGVMYKRDEFDFLPDPSLRATSTDIFGEERTDIVGFNAADTVRGETDSKEVYVEANFPLLTDLPAVRSLDATLGYRFADHSVAGNMSSYKAEGIWALNETFTVRGGYQHALRAPNIFELFRPAVINFPAAGLGDPCSNDFVGEGGVLGAQDDPDARALCIAQGIPDATLDSFNFANSQFQGLSGGNPELTEETADTYTLGLVFQPGEGLLDGFQASVDYYTIEIEDAISALDAELLVGRCFNRTYNPELSNDNFYCTQFRRLSSTGTITEVAEIDTNIGAFTLEGVDLQVDYTADAGPGQVRAKWVSTYLSSFEEESVQGEEPVDSAGTASSGFDALPEWKWTMSLGYGWQGFDGDLRWRHVGEMQDFAFPSFTLDSIDYYDVTFGYSFSDRLEGLRLRAGVTNLTDEDPIIYPSSQQSNTDPAQYDILGRRYFVSATYAFE